MFGTDEISDNLIRRKILFTLTIIIAGFCVLAVRLGHLQIVCTRYYTKRSEDNRIRPVRLIPPRGVLYDRNGTKPLADNETAYDVCVAPNKAEYLQVIDPRRQEAFRRLELTPAEYEDILSKLKKVEKRLV